jgi:hypothetical protein
MKLLQNMQNVGMQNVKHMLNMLKIVKYAEYAPLHSTSPAVTRANLGAGGSEVLCTRPAATGLRLGHSMDRPIRRGSTGCSPAAISGTLSHLSSITIFKHIEIFQSIFQT